MAHHEPARSGGVTHAHGPFVPRSVFDPRRLDRPYDVQMRTIPQRF